MKAFTLVELLICITIIGLLAVMSITAYPKFSEQIALTGETYKVLAYLRETQTFGISTVPNPGTKIVYAYLLEATTSAATSTIKRVQIQNPTTETNQYYITSAVVDASTTSYILDKNYRIFKLNAFYKNSTSSLTFAYGFFKRPNPESRIIGKIGASVIQPTSAGTESFGKLEIILQSKKNSAFMKKIVILQTGQMYVEDN